MGYIGLGVIARLVVFRNNVVMSLLYRLGENITARRAKF